MLAVRAAATVTLALVEALAVAVAVAVAMIMVISTIAITVVICCFSLFLLRQTALHPGLCGLQRVLHRGDAQLHAQRLQPLRHALASTSGNQHVNALQGGGQTLVVLLEGLFDF